jgi:adenylate cyclase
LSVRLLTGARNPAFYRGKEARRLEVKPGESFVIGTTVFTISPERSTPTPDAKPVLQSRTVSAEELKRIPFRDAPHRIDVLSRLPNVISGAANDPELFMQLVNMLLAGIGKADAIAVVAVEPPADPEAAVRVLYWDLRQAGEETFQPSKRLVREAIQHTQRTVLHVWGVEHEAGAQTFTLMGHFDWAFCTPVPGEACRGLGIYVAGRFSGEDAATLLAPWESNELGDDLKFTELVASILGSLRQVQKLQHDQAVLSRFFSPAVQRLLTQADPEQALRPREAEVTILFCDLRGFSRKLEQAASNLMGELEQVSKALGVMTRHILEHGGTIADFLGDAALGFWGWPIAQPDMVLIACLAALGIRTHYEAQAQRSGRFAVGIGVATGRAVAGRIGTTDQAKVTVFGPVVNLASRLEGMTKILHAPVLVDEATATGIREKMPPEQARCRRLARVRPFGLATPLMVSEILPPAAAFPQLSDDHLAHYETALDLFLRGDWTEAYRHLHQVPPGDRAKDLLTGFIIQNNHTPPTGWDGVIPLERKS